MKPAAHRLRIISLTNLRWRTSILASLNRLFEAIASVLIASRKPSFQRQDSADEILPVIVLSFHD